MIAYATLLTDEEFDAILKSIQQVASVIKRPINSTEAQTLPKLPTDAREGMAYIDFSVKRIIQALQSLPEIVSMPLSDRTILLQASITLTNRTQLDTVHTVMRFLSFHFQLPIVTFTRENQKRYVQYTYE